MRDDQHNKRFKVSTAEFEISAFTELEDTLKKTSQYLSPFQRQLLLENLQTDLSPECRLRIEIMLLADTNHSQSQICARLMCCQETARYWIAMVQVGQFHRWNECYKGRPNIINEQFLNLLKELVNHAPREYGYPFTRWTGQWLAKHLAKELNITVSAGYINMLLKEMGLSARHKTSQQSN